MTWVSSAGSTALLPLLIQWKEVLVEEKKTDRLAVPPLPWPARAGQFLVRSLPETNTPHQSKRRTN